MHHVPSRPMSLVELRNVSKILPSRGEENPGAGRCFPGYRGRRVLISIIGPFPASGKSTPDAHPRLVWIRRARGNHHARWCGRSKKGFRLVQLAAHPKSEDRVVVFPVFFNLLPKTQRPCRMSSLPMIYSGHRREGAKGGAPLASFGIRGYGQSRERHRPSQLSGGQQQRAAIGPCPGEQSAQSSLRTSQPATLIRIPATAHPESCFRKLSTEGRNDCAGDARSRKLRL